jgi:hypothetical protein
MENASEQIRELYARFGLAYYESEVLHRSLCVIYALGTFEKPESITRPRLDEKLTYAYSLTFGRVINETKHIFSTEIQNKLDIALAKRNYLAHKFWFEKNYLMFREQGVIKLHDELMKYVDYFTSLDKIIQNYFRPIRQKFGITDELLKSEYERLLDGKPDDPLISQRPLKKLERIINAWDVEIEEGINTQVFETDDGYFWQLCDVGLGWSIFSEQESSWKLNKEIQQFLPVNLNPRPAISEPWNYEFQLSKGAIFFIKRGKKEKSYSWGIKDK